MIYRCCDPRRRELVLDHVTLNGIDFLEVLDQQAPTGTPAQRTLLLRFLKPAPSLTLDNFALSGGERIIGIGLEWVMPANAPDTSLFDEAVETGLEDFLKKLPQADHVLALRTDSSGDYANYRLRLIAGPGALSPPAGIDRLLAQMDFSFKVECPSEFDCAPQHNCPETFAPPPALSYLAKDYRSLRRLMLQRMAQLLPAWRERNPADTGVTLVELLAYVGDRLSYAQDATATEAYLATARQRSSVRRHARLVDYFMHDGGNARAWIHLQVDTDNLLIEPQVTRFLTRLTGEDPTIEPGRLKRLLPREPLVFEPLHGKRLFVLHNHMDFYVWGDEECCLPRGATRATLAGDFPDLAVGDVLIFEERLGPRTGRAADADPQHRHAVRLCAVEAGLTDDLTGAVITEIRWVEEDALPLAICISSRLDESLGGGQVERVSHALGNILLADHGLSIAGEDLGSVPEPHLYLVPEAGEEPCRRPEARAVPPRYRPQLAEGPVSQSVPYDTAQPPASAYAALDLRHDQRCPSIKLVGQTGIGDRDWSAKRDLLQSFAADAHFVVETEADGAAHLRFGDDRNGLRPATGTRFTADYRIGNGVLGNVGADAIRHIVTAINGVVAVRNPLAARGGVDPETTEEVRKTAPYAYRRQERAVTSKDYAEVARRHPDVQRAEATFRWNGHGHTVFITVDRFEGRPVTAEFETELRAFVERFRMAGYDLEIDAPRYAALELGLLVCAAPDHFRSEIRREVLEVLSAQVLPDGRRGLFHPDNWTFGQSVYLSAIYAAVMAIEGVTSVDATRFRRRGQTNPTPLLDGLIRLGRLDIARLDNDPNFPERGAVAVEMRGGK